jgi:hypothetical protein
MKLLPGSSSDSQLLQFLTRFGAHIGRTNYTLVGTRPVYSNLYLLLSGSGGPDSAAQEVEKFFSVFAASNSEGPLEIRTGISDVQSLLYAIRDPLTRPERGYKRGKPEFWDTLVDRGTGERRVTITQPLIPLISANSRSAGLLRDLLTAAFNDDRLAAWMDVRSGGFLRSTGAHVSVITRCEADELMWLPHAVADLFIFGSAGDGASCFSDIVPADDNQFTLLQNAVEEALCHRPREVTITSQGKSMFEAAVKQLGSSPATATRLAKIGLNYALLDCSDRVTAEHAAAAIEVVRHSASMLPFMSKHRVEKIVDVIHRALAANQGGLTRTQINDLFNGRTPSSDIHAALLHLEWTGAARAEPKKKTKGRPTERWYSAPGITQ